MEVREEQQQQVNSDSRRMNTISLYYLRTMQRAMQRETMRASLPYTFEYGCGRRYLQSLTCALEHQQLKTFGAARRKTNGYLESVLFSRFKKMRAPNQKPQSLNDPGTWKHGHAPQTPFSAPSPWLTCKNLTQKGRGKLIDKDRSTNAPIRPSGDHRIAYRLCCITLGDLPPFSKSHLLVNATLDTFVRFPDVGVGVAGTSPSTLLLVLDPKALLLMLLTLDAKGLLFPAVLAPSGLATIILLPCTAFWNRGLTGEAA